MHLLHGGEFVRIQFLTFSGKFKTVWTSIEDFKRLDSAGYLIDSERSVLGEDKIMHEELQVALTKFDDMGCNVANEVIWFSEKGNITDPELFEQIIKGKSIDTSDYFISMSSKDKPWFSEGSY